MQGCTPHNMVALTAHELSVLALFQTVIADCLPGAFAYHTAVRDMGSQVEILWWPDPDQTRAIAVLADAMTLTRAFDAGVEQEGGGEDRIELVAQDMANRAWQRAHEQSLVTCAERPQLYDGTYDHRHDDGDDGED